MSDFWAYSWGPYLAVIIIFGLSLWNLCNARTFGKKI